MRSYTRRSAQEWSALVDQQLSSGKSAPAYCSEHGVAYASFIQWRKRLAKADSSQTSTDATPEFIELTAAAPADHPVGTQPNRGSQIVVEVGSHIKLTITHPDNVV